MRGKADNATHAAAIARVMEVSSHADVLRRQLEEVLESSAFRGSRRSQELLRFIVERALDGQFERLKERTIGVELFHRPPNYDTGEDSIVRVGASDVRKRLLQYYAEIGHDAAFHIELPAGSYIPEFRQTVELEQPAAIAPETEVVATTVAVSPAPRVSDSKRWVAILPYIALLLGLGGMVWAGLEKRALARQSDAIPAAKGVPWTSMFERDRRTYVIISDVNFGVIQDLLGETVPLADYAARRYWNGALPPDDSKAVGLLLRRQFTAVPDVGLSVGISELAQSVGHRVTVRSARNIQVQDFKTDDNFILLGSVRTNPWISLFDDQLDFRMEYDAASHRMICRNNAPKHGESALYSPTSISFSAGSAYATLSFIRNPNQAGHILSIAGTNGEGTEMAGKLVINHDLLWPVLERAGLKPDGNPRSFQALLRLNALAGSPTGFEVIAWHWLQEKH